MEFMKNNEKLTIDERTMNALVMYMDDEKREQVHMELAPCTNEEFIARYMELDEEFEDLLDNEFGITIL